MNPLLSISELRAGYGPIEVLKGISINVYPGEMVAIIGANGAGKTTTLMCVSGILQSSGGEVHFDGERVDKLPAHQIVERGLVQVPEGRKIFSRLTVRENLEMGCYLRAAGFSFDTEVREVYELFPVLRERANQLGGTLSGGEQQMLAIGRALMARPKILLLDEPSMGVAPLLVTKIFATIKNLNQKGLTILLVEQNAHLALKVATRGYVMETGSITIEDQAAKLLQDPRVREAYLGEASVGGFTSET